MGFLPIAFFVFRCFLKKMRLTYLGFQYFLKKMTLTYLGFQHFFKKTTLTYLGFQYFLKKTTLTYLGFQYFFKKTPQKHFIAIGEKVMLKFEGEISLPKNKLSMLFFKISRFEME